MRTNENFEEAISSDVDMIEYYERLQKDYQLIVANGGTDKDLQELLSSLKEDYEALKTAKNDALAAAVDNLDAMIEDGDYSFSGSLVDYGFNYGESARTKILDDLMKNKGYTYEEATYAIDHSSTLGKYEAAEETTKRIAQKAFETSVNTFWGDDSSMDSETGAYQVYTGDSLKSGEIA
jgi:hypothetical protein